MSLLEVKDLVVSYGGIEENCSIEALFYAARERLQDRVQELLFS